MKNQNGFTAVELLWVVWLIVSVAGFIGWIMNIVKVVAAINDPITGFFVLRCVGTIAAPLGAVLGYF